MEIFELLSARLTSDQRIDRLAKRFCSDRFVSSLVAFGPTHNARALTERASLLQIRVKQIRLRCADSCSRTSDCFATKRECEHERSRDQPSSRNMVGSLAARRRAKVRIRRASDLQLLGVPSARQAKSTCPPCRDTQSFVRIEVFPLSAAEANQARATRGTLQGHTSRAEAKQLGSSISGNARREATDLGASCPTAGAHVLRSRT